MEGLIIILLISLYSRRRSRSKSPFRKDKSPVR